MSDPLRAVASRRREWTQAVNAADVERYGEVVTEDVVWLPPSGDPIEGRDAFRAWVAPYFERYLYDFSLDPAEVRAFAGWCAERGRFRSVLTPTGDGDAMEHEGSYFALWRLDGDGVWRIERYVDGME